MSVGATETDSIGYGKVTFDLPKPKMVASARLQSAIIMDWWYLGPQLAFHVYDPILTEFPLASSGIDDARRTGSRDLLPR